MSELRQSLARLIAGRSLSEEQSGAAVEEIFTGDAPPPALVAGFLMALKIKGENGAELTGAVRTLLRHAKPLSLGNLRLLDTAGTGGDSAASFNISTGAALVAAAAGAKVAKHGNRAASGRVGAADLVEQLGIKIDLEPEGLRRCLEKSGMCFVFAQKYHPVMARVASLRRELGVSTLFNLLGPLANPARPQRQLIGISDPAKLGAMAEALTELGTEHALLVRGEDGVDEISISDKTTLIEVKRTGGQTGQSKFSIAPEDFGLRRAAGETITIKGSSQASEMLRSALAGEQSAACDTLALNGGAAIYVAGLSDSLADGVARARTVLKEGLPLRVLERLRVASLSGQGS
jgi:anthranilate phosphoribosyltransferase